MKWILLIFALIFSFCLYSRKYNNPFKLYFIFGKKGSGKSTYMVMLARRYLKKGWNVYTNIEDMNLPGLRFFDPRLLDRFTPESNSVVLIDEAGLLWSNRDFKSFSAGLTEWYKLQRKYKCLVYVNSQSFDVDKKIRDLTDGMYLMNNIGNVIGIVRPIIRTVTLTEPTGEAESRIADKLRFASIFSWKFLWFPKYFKYFDSFSAPARPPIPYRVKNVVKDVSELRENNVYRVFRRLKNENNKKDD